MAKITGIRAEPEIDVIFYIRIKFDLAVCKVLTTTMRALQSLASIVIKTAPATEALAPLSIAGFRYLSTNADLKTVLAEKIPQEQVGRII